MKPNGFNRRLFCNGRRLSFTCNDLIDMVCEYLDAPREDIFSDSKKALVVYPRHICCYLLTELSDLTVEDLANGLGLNTSSVYYARNVIVHELRHTTNPRYAYDVNHLTEILTI